MSEEWKLEIKKVSNGYILKGKFGNSEIITEDVIQIPDNIPDKEAEQNAMLDLLWEVMEYFGVYKSKHNETNVVVKIEKTEENK